ncbi:hypothetical protein HK098_005764 [Nowakowskiella sp. JEL0407]|nr:hypothetical protein HK098_005764 [Nowakowskiella sp. JEL0407]
MSDVKSDTLTETKLASPEPSDKSALPTKPASPQQEPANPSSSTPMSSNPGGLVGFPQFFPPGGEANFPMPPYYPYYHPLYQQPQFMGYPYRPPVQQTSPSPTTKSSSSSSAPKEIHGVQTPPRGRPRKKTALSSEKLKEERAPCECEKCSEKNGDAGEECLIRKAAAENKVVAVGTLARPHVCNECGQGFHREHDLSRHVKTRHLGLRPFHCDVCGKSFSRSDAYKRHKITEEARTTKKRDSNEAEPIKKKRKEKDESEKADENAHLGMNAMAGIPFDAQQMFQYQQAQYQAFAAAAARGYPYPYPMQYPMGYPQMTEQQRQMYAQHAQMFASFGMGHNPFVQEGNSSNESRDNAETTESNEKKDEEVSTEAQQPKKEPAAPTSDAADLVEETIEETGDVIAEGADGDDDAQSDGSDWSQNGKSRKKNKMAPKLRAKKGLN